MINESELITKVVPKERAEAWAQFNKISQAFVGIVQKVPLEELNTEFYEYVEVDIDLETETIQGTKNDFKIIVIAEQPQPISEKALDNRAYAKIDQVYPIYKRLDVLEAAVAQLCVAHNTPNAPLEEMRDYIQEVKRVNTLIKEDLAADPAFAYMSRAEEQEKFDAEIEGGLHEFYGPREANPAILDVPMLPE